MEETVTELDKTWNVEMRKKAFQVARDTLSRGSEMVKHGRGSENSFARVWPETRDGKEKTRCQIGIAARSQVLNCLPLLFFSSFNCLSFPFN